MDEPEKNMESQTPEAAPAPSPVMTEERVTKKVIRRRAKAAAPPPEPEKIEEPVVLPVEEEAPREEVKVEAEKVEAESEAPTEIVVAEEPVEVAPPSPEEGTEPVGTEKEEVPTAPAEMSAEEAAEAEKDPDYLPAYKRLKVVAAPAVETTEPHVVQPAPPQAAGADSVGSVLASPSSSGLGRKEIIEIRDFHRPKGSKKRRMAPGKKARKTEITTPKAAKRVIRISDSVTVVDLAKKMSTKSNELIRKLMGMGMMVTINQPIDVDTATLVASEFGYGVENVAMAPEDLLLEQEEQQTSVPENMHSRPPVVTVMGHVDHGKTTLLDYIRKTDVAAGEAGGITQHIGAYSVKTDSGKVVTFVDTPGHEAFTAMRARGAQVTDIVVLVVAADDGVMPQTKEAINHAQSAGVPLIIALNKMDKPGVNPDRIKKELTEFELVPEEWGGETIYVPISAKTGDGVSQLLELLLLQSDMLELKADPKKLAKGIVVEARLDRGRGAVMTLLVQEGTLKSGDVVVTGTLQGKIRAMRDDKGSPVREAGPSTAVEIMGLSGVAKAGDLVQAVGDEKRAKQISEMRLKISREQELAKTGKVTLDDLYQRIDQGEVKELKAIIKADTAGSVEVLSDSLQRLSTDKVTMKVIQGAVGGISENDVMLAAASGALIIGFHVRPESGIRNLAEEEKVEIRLYDVIYELTEDVVKAMTGLLAPKQVDKSLGQAEVKELFVIPRQGTVAGCQVREGKILRSNQVRLIRDNVPIYTGRLKSLRRFKDDVREVTNGLECGMAIENFNDIKVGDVIEAFEVEEISATL